MVTNLLQMVQTVLMFGIISPKIYANYIKDFLPRLLLNKKKISKSIFCWAKLHFHLNHYHSSSCDVSQIPPTNKSKLYLLNAGG